MADRANVTSLQQLTLLHDSLIGYRSAMGKELEALGVELRRLTNWIQTEARQYWSAELTSAQRHFMECQDALVRCRSYVREDERRPCTEEKKRFEKAKQRRILCEQMLRLVAAASTKWEQEQNKNAAKIHRLNDFVESDLKVAANHLARSISLLESYARLQSAPLASSTDSSLASVEANKANTATESASQGSSDSESAES